jgi:hypothetical protein
VLTSETTKRKSSKYFSFYSILLLHELSWDRHSVPLYLAVSISYIFRGTLKKSIPQNNKVIGSISVGRQPGLHLPDEFASKRVTKRFSSGQGIVGVSKL